VGLYHVQSLRARPREILWEIATIIQASPTASSKDSLLSQAKSRQGDHADLPGLVRKYGTIPARLQRSRWWLIGFEAWNLLVIGASLVGFSHVTVLASSPWTFCALWPVAIITVAVTVGSVIAWTSE
jgi:hypothetical protein